MAHGWMRALKTTPGLADAITIVGLVDLDRSVARSLAEAFDLTDAVVGTDLDRVLEETGADLLFDVVVPVARKAVVATGLKHGCHVLSEKPMATSLEDARELIALAETAGRMHAVVQNRRFISGIRRMRRFVEGGAIGELTGVHCDFFIAPHFGGFREQMDNVLLLDMAIHTFDAARFVSGKRPLSAYCLETNPAGSWYAHGASANAIFKFSDDVAFTYRGSWCAEGRRTSWESAWRLVGSKGMLTWDGEEAFEATVVGTGEGLLRGHRPIDVPPAPREEETHGHASVIADFLNATRSGRPPETAGFDNIKSLAMVFGAIESARTGQPVAIQV